GFRMPPGDVFNRTRPFLAHEEIDFDACHAAAELLAHVRPGLNPLQKLQAASAVRRGQAPALGVAQERPAAAQQGDEGIDISIREIAARQWSGGSPRFAYRAE